MIDSLLFLTDAAAAAPAAGVALDDAEAAAAVAATESGYAYAARGAWTAALAALEHSAAVRDALAAGGAAGPAVAARGWCDVATVRLAAGDRAGAREALVRARLARGSAHELPHPLATAFAELDAELAPGMPQADIAAPDTDVGAESAAEVTATPEAGAGGLLWLDTTDDTRTVEPVAVEPVTVESAAVEALTPNPARSDGDGEQDPGPADSAAIDAAVALAGAAAGGDDGAARGWGGRLRRLFRR